MRLISQRYQVSTIAEQSSIDYLTEYYLDLTREVCSITIPYNACASAILLTTSLGFYSNHRNGFPEALTEKLESLEGLRIRHLGSLRNYLDTCHSGIMKDPTTRKTISVMLDCLVSYIDIIRTPDHIDEGNCVQALYSSNLTDL